MISVAFRFFWICSLWTIDGHGSFLCPYDLGRRLARDGYLVSAVRYHGDNYSDAGGTARWSVRAATSVNARASSAGSWMRCW